MKKLWAMSLTAAVACAPIIASADQQQEIDALQSRVAALEDAAVDESRELGDPEAENRYFGLGSGVYNQELYIHDFGLNKDLNLLHQRRFLNESGIEFMGHPSLLMSGYVFARAGKHSDRLPTDDAQHEQFIEGEVGVDFTGFVNDSWLTYFQLEGYGFGDDQGVVIDQGFTTFGNLDNFPVYATAGYFYPAFGDYTTQFITNTLPRDLGRIRAPAVSVGYAKMVEGNWDINSSVFVFDGDSKTSDNFRLDEVGANIQARKEGLGPEKNIAINLGASIVNNMASSLGIRNEAENLPGSRLGHYVPAYDVRAKFLMGGFYILAEYMSATRHFDNSDFTQTKAGGGTNAIMPSAFSSETGYRFDIWGVPSVAGLTYQNTDDTLAFDLPKEQYGAVFQISPFRNTKITFEYLQKKDYAKNQSTSNGNTGTGKTDDLFQGELSVFF